MSLNVHTEPPGIRFKYEKDGRMSVAVVGKEVEYQGAFDREKVVSAVRRLGLGLKDRASLYLQATDYCQDDAVAEVLLSLAEGCAERASRIDAVRQRFDIPLTPIGDANNCVNNPFARGQNEGVAAVPPSTVERFHPQLPIAITKEIREHLVCALEGTFVPYNRGEMALRALGLLPGELGCYVDWIDGLKSLTAVMLFLLGHASFELEDDEVVNGSLLPAGSYGNGTAVVAQRRGCDCCWKMVAALFRDARGGLLNAGSLRSVASEVRNRDGREFRNVLYLFRPLIFDAYDKPRQNGLFQPQGSGLLERVGTV